MIQHCPTPTELDDLELLVSGAYAPVTRFNEPGSPVDSRTRVLTLTDESIEQARGYFEGRTVPTQAISAGVATLLEARKIVLLVSGESKAGIIRDAIYGPQTPDVPASFLQLAGSRVEVVVDEAAASEFPA